MDKKMLKKLLDSVASGDMSTDDACAKLKSLPFEDLGFAKIDHHRAVRRGFPETVFCQGKTCEQVVEIVSRMRNHGGNVLATRCDRATADAVLASDSNFEYHEAARVLTLTQEPIETLKGHIAVVCAGTSDIPVAEEAVITCEMLGNKVNRLTDVGVAGIHRLFEHREVLQDANAVIVCAGMEGALASVVGGLVDVPVVAVPTSVGYGASFGGIAALLGMLNSCASGVSVVNIDNGFGAAISASLVNRLANGKRA